MRWAALTPPTSVFLRFPQIICLGVGAAGEPDACQVVDPNVIAGQRRAVAKLTGEANLLCVGFTNAHAVDSVNALATARLARFIRHRISADLKFSGLD